MLSVLPVTRPAAPLFRLAGSKYVQTKWDAKDKKKHEEGKLVKSRNEPCCIVQVRCAALCCAALCSDAWLTSPNKPCCAMQPRCVQSNACSVQECERQPCWLCTIGLCVAATVCGAYASCTHLLRLHPSCPGAGGGGRPPRHRGPAAARSTGLQQHAAAVLLSWQHCSVTRP